MAFVKLTNNNYELGDIRNLHVAKLNKDGLRQLRNPCFANVSYIEVPDDAQYLYVANWILLLLLILANLAQ